MKKFYSLVMLMALVGATGQVGASPDSKFGYLFHSLRDDIMDSQIKVSKMANKLMRLASRDRFSKKTLETHRAGYTLAFSIKKKLSEFLQELSNVNVHDSIVHDRDPIKKNGWTLLHYVAAISYTRSVAEALLQKGADVNAVDADGNTPLHIAVGEKRTGFLHKDLIKLLIEEGADVHARNNENKTPLKVLKDNSMIGRKNYSFPGSIGGKTYEFYQEVRKKARSDEEAKAKEIKKILKEAMGKKTVVQRVKGLFQRKKKPQQPQAAAK